MKSRKSTKKRVGHNSGNEFDDKSGLRPINKSKNGKSKRISIYDVLEDDFDLPINSDFNDFEEDNLDDDDLY